MKQELSDILFTLNQVCGIDFSGYSPGMIERRIAKRQTACGCSDLKGYHAYLSTHPEEPEYLLDSLTIKVSRFFRDALTFEYLAARILPSLLSLVESAPSRPLRIWSAGCSTGEEPYSIAMLLHDLLKQQERSPETAIFATDISHLALEKAKEGAYDYDSVQDIKLRFFNDYFTRRGDRFLIRSTIKQQVYFGSYDLLSKTTSSPPESIFGSFDLVLCRNVLIYLNDTQQEEIFHKLHRSLAANGYLILGESEALSVDFQFKFTQVNGCCRIYQKIG
jgi:chemotaxis methyl-accepting protein methylase